jgi:hypothetical protein
MLALAAALGATQAVAEKGGDAKKPDAKKPDKGAKVAKVDPNAAETLELPIPKGQPQKGVKVPLYGADGRLRMNFEIGVGTRLDDENVKLEKLRVETFREDGTQELDMDLPDAVYNQKTNVISSQTKVFIKRSDFELTGNTMAFNIKTREGTLGGGVKMIITDLGQTSGTDKKPEIQFQPQPTDPKKPTDTNAPK